MTANIQYVETTPSFCVFKSSCDNDNDIQLIDSIHSTTNNKCKSLFSLKMYLVQPKRNVNTPVPLCKGVYNMKCCDTLINSKVDQHYQPVKSTKLCINYAG